MTVQPPVILHLGDPVLVFDPDWKNRPPVEARIAKIGRVWVTAAHDNGYSQWRFRIDTQREETGTGHGGRYFRTPEQHEHGQRLTAARENLLAHGLDLTFRQALPDAHLLAVSALLDELDAACDGGDHNLEGH